MCLFHYILCLSPLKTKNRTKMQEKQDQKVIFIVSPFTQILNLRTFLKKFYSHIHTTLIILMIFFPYFFLPFLSFHPSSLTFSSPFSCFLLHLPFEFLSFPPSPICTSPSTINQLASPAPIQPFRRPSSPP